MKKIADIVLPLVVIGFLIALVVYLARVPTLHTGIRCINDLQFHERNGVCFAACAWAVMVVPKEACGSDETRSEVSPVP